MEKFFFSEKGKKLVVRFTFHGQIENEEKRLFPKGRIIIVIVYVSSSCALVVVFLEGEKKKKKKTSARERAVSRDNGGYLWIQITVYRRLEFLIKKQRGRLRTGRCPMPGVNEHEITSVTPCEKWRCRRSFYPRPLNSSFHALKFSLSFLSPPPRPPSRSYFSYFVLVGLAGKCGPERCRVSLLWRGG